MQLNIKAPAADAASLYPPEFRLFLQEELVRRCKKNPRFSLRAFARTLDVEASALSKILNGKRSLTPRMLHRLSAQLGLGPDEVRRYEASLRPGRAALRPPLVKPAELRPLAADEFAVSADWYHDAILELVAVAGFQPSGPWIARALGITVSEANFAVERLFRLGRLAAGAGGRWLKTAGAPTKVVEPFTGAANRRLQRQILAQAQEALESVPAGARDQASVTVAVSRARLEGAKAKIRQFRRELSAYLEADGDVPDEVYQLSVSFFPVSRAQGPVTPPL
jgi:transcriptional regulator with XRE-family HTH domain